MTLFSHTTHYLYLFYITWWGVHFTYTLFNTMDTKEMWAGVYEQIGCNIVPIKNHTFILINDLAYSNWHRLPIVVEFSRNFLVWRGLEQRRKNGLENNLCFQVWDNSIFCIGLAVEKYSNQNILVWHLEEATTSVAFRINKWSRSWIRLLGLKNMDQPRPLFRFFSFFTRKKSILCTVLGFEPATIESSAYH